MAERADTGEEEVSEGSAERGGETDEAGARAAGDGSKPKKRKTRGKEKGKPGPKAVVEEPEAKGKPGPKAVAEEPAEARLKASAASALGYLVGHAVIWLSVLGAVGYLMAKGR